MELHQNIFSKLGPRQVKFLTILGIGLAGIAIATIGYMFTGNQTVQISQVGMDLYHSPVGTVFTTIASLLFC